MPGFTPETLNVPWELQNAPDTEKQWPLGRYTVSAHHGRNALWGPSEMVLTDLCRPYPDTGLHHMILIPSGISNVSTDIIKD